ncbi:MAG: HlyD family secretion protein [Chitinophagales bacterium]
MEAKRIVALAVIIILGLGGYWAYDRYSPKDAGVVQATGTIEAKTVELSARTAGVIARVLVDEGDKVKQGQLAAEIQRKDLLAQRENNALGVAKAQAQLEDLVSGARAQEKSQSAAAVNIARVNYEKAKSDLDKKQALFDGGAISSDELERYQTNLEVTRNQLASAESGLSLIESGSRPQSIAAARTAVEQAKAVLKASDVALNDLKITSPLDGTVISRNYEPGEVAQAGTSIATVADLEHLWIKVYIPIDELPAVKLGEEVDFTVSGSSKVFTGTVSYIASKGEFTPRSVQTKNERANIVFAVKIRTGSQGGLLKPGMPADVVFNESK